MADDDDDEFDVLPDDDDFDLIGDEEEEGDTVTHLSRPQSVVSVRRAIEQRMEQRRMDRMLNYLELDFEDEE